MATSHKRETTARRTPPAFAVLGSLAALATVGAVAIGVIATDPAARELSPLSAASGTAAVSRGPAPVTRSDDRTRTTTAQAPEVTATPATPETLKMMSRAAVRQAVSSADTRKWSTTTLNLWTRPDDKAVEQGELEPGKKVLVTGRTAQGRTEIVVDGESRWVTDGYLSKDKPLGAGAGLSMAPCPDSSVEYRLTQAAVYVYRSVCHAFPQITTYGGWDAHGEHASGKAIDIMTSDVALGTAIAQFLQEHASELDLYDIIWRQHIWTPVRASEGWRFMPSRGSTTANHYDHVHVSVN